MTPLLWSIVLSTIGIAGVWIAGQKNKAGWAIGLCVQPLWIIFAIQTGQYGFIANACVYAAVYARNWTRWRRDERAAARKARRAATRAPQQAPAARHAARATPHKHRPAEDRPAPRHSA